jgi:hypothetical protein
MEAELLPEDPFPYCPLISCMVIKDKAVGRKRGRKRRRRRRRRKEGEGGERKVEEGGRREEKKKDCCEPQRRQIFLIAMHPDRS